MKGQINKGLREEKLGEKLLCYLGPRFIPVLFEKKKEICVKKIYSFKRICSYRDRIILFWLPAGE